MNDFLRDWHEACEIDDEDDGPLVREIKTMLSLGVPLPATLGDSMEAQS